MNWYYIKNGQQLGPVDEPEIVRLARQGELRREDRVWNASMGGEWGFAYDVPGLFTAEPPPVPPDRTRPDLAPCAVQACSTGGGTPNADLMRLARESLQDRWWRAVGAALIVSLLPMPLAMIPVIGTLALYALMPPLQLGWAGFNLSLARRTAHPEAGRVFDGFHNFWKAIGLFLLTNMYIFLWTLLLIIPGIIAAYSYAMAFFILADHPGIDVNDAIANSKRIMRGNKWKLFCLFCRFIGWALLSVLSCGIGFLFLIPYMQVSLAHFYEDIRGSQMLTNPQS